MGLITKGPLKELWLDSPWFVATNPWFFAVRPGMIGRPQNINFKISHRTFEWKWDGFWYGFSFDTWPYEASPYEHEGFILLCVVDSGICPLSVEPPGIVSECAANYGIKYHMYHLYYWWMEWIDRHQPYLHGFLMYLGYHYWGKQKQLIGA